jgi:hypothetical protein
MFLVKLFKKNTMLHCVNLSQIKASVQSYIAGLIIEMIFAAIQLVWTHLLGIKYLLYWDY